MLRSREFKEGVFEQFAKIAAAFSSPKRLEIIDVLAQGERDVDTLAGEVGLTMANTSRHLQVLKNARLVAFRKEGVRVVYRLADPIVLSSWKSLQALAESRLAEVTDTVRRYFEKRDGMEPVGREDLLKRAQAGDVVVLDVRPQDEFNSGHIEGAISIPLSDLEKRLGELPAHRDVVAYCRGPYCVLSVKAIELLRKSGRRAFRLVDGFPEWREAGLPVEDSRPTTDN
ncbi:MAG: metalloregulator ArsR/SmtB family transcription factor [Deltaproteobacteria bacterium]|nr:metalloregulator ArsR/SmtB family transcription factor [Deltaproteobacteria bacterium]